MYVLCRERRNNSETAKAGIDGPLGLSPLYYRYNYDVNSNIAPVSVMILVM